MLGCFINIVMLEEIFNGFSQVINQTCWIMVNQSYFQIEGLLIIIRMLPYQGIMLKYELNLRKSSHYQKFISPQNIARTSTKAFLKVKDPKIHSFDLKPNDFQFQSITAIFGFDPNFSCLVLKFILSIVEHQQIHIKIVQIYFRPMF